MIQGYLSGNGKKSFQESLYFYRINVMYNKFILKKSGTGGGRVRNEKYIIEVRGKQMGRSMQRKELVLKYIVVREPWWVFVLSLLKMETVTNCN